MADTTTPLKRGRISDAYTLAGIESRARTGARGLREHEHSPQCDATATAPATATVAPPTATSSATGAATIKMGSVNFTVGNATVKAGQAVMFVDPTPGGIHHLVTGHNGTFAAEAGAPSQFATADGVSFSPGDSMSISFRRRAPMPSPAQSIP